MPTVGVRTCLITTRPFLERAVTAQIIESDATAGIKIKLPKSDGHDTWTDGQIAQFEEARSCVADLHRSAPQRRHPRKARYGTLRPLVKEPAPSFADRRVIELRGSSYRARLATRPWPRAAGGVPTLAAAEVQRSEIAWV